MVLHEVIEGKVVLVFVRLELKLSSSVGVRREETRTFIDFIVEVVTHFILTCDLFYWLMKVLLESWTHEVVDPWISRHCFNILKKLTIKFSK